MFVRLERLSQRTHVISETSPIPFSIRDNISRVVAKTTSGVSTSLDSLRLRLNGLKEQASQEWVQLGELGQHLKTAVDLTELGKRCRPKVRQLYMVFASAMLLGSLAACGSQPISVNNPCTWEQIEKHHYYCSYRHFDPKGCEQLASRTLQRNHRLNAETVIAHGSVVCLTLSQPHQIIDSSLPLGIIPEDKLKDPDGCYNINAAAYSQEYCPEKSSPIADFFNKAWHTIRWLVPSGVSAWVAGKIGLAVLRHKASR